MGEIGNMANITKEILYDLYVTRGLSFRKCAEKLGMPTHGGMPTLLKKFGISARKGGFQKGNTVGNGSGDKASGWKGGKQTVKCNNCGKDLEKFPSLIKAKNFCDKTCWYESRTFDMTNKRVGMLRFIKKAGRDKNNHIQWECTCE